MKVFQENKSRAHLWLREYQCNLYLIYSCARIKILGIRDYNYKHSFFIRFYRSLNNMCEQCVSDSIDYPYRTLGSINSGLLEFGGPIEICVRLGATLLTVIARVLLSRLSAGSEHKCDNRAKEIQSNPPEDPNPLQVGVDIHMLPPHEAD